MIFVKPIVKTKLWTSTQRKEIVKKLAMCGSFIPRIKQEIDEAIEAIEAFEAYAEREVACLAEYLSFYIKGQKKEFRSLYIGERLKMVYDADCTHEERNNRLVEIVSRDREVFKSRLSIENHALQAEVVKFFDDIILEFQAPIEYELRILFIGDCLHLDVIGFLSGMTMEYGASVNPHFITTKNIFQLEKELGDLGGKNFDAIFYSPVSYENNLDFSTILHYKNMFMSGFEQAEILARACDQIENVINTMMNVFDCPIFVHNTASIIREESRIKAVVKLALTFKLRKRTTKYFDKRLRAHIGICNSTKFKQVFLIDEMNLVKKVGLYKAGEFYYKSTLQHPTKFGALIAQEYDRHLYVLTHLMSKKLIVCDLDNTLWEGVIGEGEVRHFEERQAILLKLKAKGMLLAINSKNDPKNVHWRGGVLSEDDFIFDSINWSPKINAFPQMQLALNLKMKDFIFIDDRADELELVRTAYPTVEALDATQSKTWDLFELWEAMLDDADSMDRTKLYKERAVRDNFFDTAPANNSNAAEMFKNFELKLCLSEVRENQLKRTVELINRTNQFNMRGSRTNFNEAKKWIQSSDYTVIQAAMTDKFGDMGVVSIIVIEKKEQSFKIPIFVLSCRVFGYKVETVVLNEVKRRAHTQRMKSIFGEYIETANNAPCSLVYPTEMFVEAAGYWCFSIADENEIHDPEWLTVTNR